MDRPGWKNAGIAAAVLLAPGGFILGGLLVARALKKRRGSLPALIPAKAGISGEGAVQAPHETPASAGVTARTD